MCSATLPIPSSPLTELSLDELRTRRSVKWRAYPPDVLPLWVAEMDVPLAAPIRSALHGAVRMGDTGYACAGSLPEAFSGFALERHGWRVDPAACRVVPDVMRGVATALEVVTSPSDGVLINPPVYRPFFEVIAAVGRKVVTSPLATGPDGRWRLDLDRLEHDMARPDVTAYLLCDPHNPVGLVLGRDELRAVAELAERHRVRILADEIHGPLVYPGSVFTPLLTLANDFPAAASALVFTSTSKAWNLAGLKTAIVVAGPAATRDLARIPTHLESEASLLGVVAATAAYRSGGPWLDSLLAGLDANRMALRRLLAEALPGVGYHPPNATYLAWLDCRRLGLGDHPAATFLKRGRVAVNRGQDFGEEGSGHVRLNFATSPEILETAVKRIAASTPEEAGQE